MPIYSAPDKANDELTTLLLTAVPENEHGNKTLSHLAEKLGVTRAAVHRWISNQKLSPNRVTEICEISKGAVTRGQFDVYIYGE